MNIEGRTGIMGLSQKRYFHSPSSQSEENFLLMLGPLPVGCILLETDFRLKYLNPAAERIFGYHLEEMIGKLPSDLIIPLDASRRFNQILHETRTDHTQSHEFDCLTRDGSRRLCRWQFTLLNIEKPGLLVTVQEINEEKDLGKPSRIQMERIQALRTIDMAITGSMDFQITLNIILQQAMLHLKMDAAVILVYEPSAKILKYASGQGLQTEALQHTALRVGEGYAGMAALQKQVVRMPDLQNDRQGFMNSPEFSTEGFKSYYCVPLIAKGEIKGVMESFHRSPFKPDEEWLDFFETLGGQAAIAIDNAMLFNDLQRSNLELILAYDTTLEGWSRALDLRDKDTEGHTRRVTEMTERLAAAFEIKEADRLHIRRGAILHDIGKMGIPDSILLKEGPLSEDEWKIMHQHPALAMGLLSSISYLRLSLDIPFCHHEKWNGTGYPRGLKGDEIPLVARLFAVVDVFDALTSDRPYRRAWSLEQAFGYINAEKGKHFDPEVVDVFMKTIAKDEQGGRCLLGL